MLNKDFYGATETAAFLGISRMTLNRIIRRGEIEVISISSGRNGRTYLIPRRAILEFIGELD